MPSMLLVTDADWVRNDVEAAITDRTTTIATFRDAEEALAAATGAAYGVVIVDMQVGSMGGMAITRMFKTAMANDEIATAPVIMLLDRSADVFLARRARSDAWLIKPFTSQELRAALDAVLVPATDG